MAKVRSIFHLSGGLGDLTFVASSAYGRHVRAKRGTHKPAPVNDAFKKSNGLLQRANPCAKIIKDAVDIHRGVTRDGTFWTRLVSKLIEELKETDTVNFASLKNFRIAPHTLHRTFTLSNLQVRLDNELKVDVEFYQPAFNRVGRVTDYRVSVIMVSINATELRANAEVVSQYYPMIDDHARKSLTASISTLVGADAALVILKCEAMRDNKVIANVDAIGMDVVEVIQL